MFSTTLTARLSSGAYPHPEPYPLHFPRARQEEPLDLALPLRCSRDPTSALRAKCLLPLTLLQLLVLCRAPPSVGQLARDLGQLVQSPSAPMGESAGALHDLLQSKHGLEYFRALVSEWQEVSGEPISRFVVPLRIDSRSVSDIPTLADVANPGNMPSSLSFDAGQEFAFQPEKWRRMPEI